jgi:hypothetical protein
MNENPATNDDVLRAMANVPPPAANTTEYRVTLQRDADDGLAPVPCPQRVMDDAGHYWKVIPAAAR